MKLTTISRDEESFTRSTSTQRYKQFRNIDPKEHPLERSREYTRAIKAAKLTRIFSKPLVTVLDGHSDGVCCMRRHPHHLTTLASGSYNGEIKLWNVATRSCLTTFKAHETIVKGIALSPTHVLSAGTDKRIVISELNPSHSYLTPKIEFLEPEDLAFSCVDWQRNPKANWDSFASGGTEKVHLWDLNRTRPVRSLTWGVDQILSLKFNPVELDQLGTTCSDRSFVLYDLRGHVPVAKLVLENTSNSLSWNPMEPFMITLANENTKCLTFDVRNLKSAYMVHEGFTSAVIDIDYSPTGKEFVAGSYDNSIRIFGNDRIRSREIYTAQRMHKILCIQFSGDSHYILSGSDDMNIRLWKSIAWKPIRPLSKPEQIKMDYNEALLEKYQSMPQVKQIYEHRNLPKRIYNKQKDINAINKAKKRKLDNKEAHSKPGTVVRKPRNETDIVKVIE